MDEPDNEGDDDFAHAKLIEAVENQLEANQPPAAQATLKKLTLVGYDREESLDLMAQALAHSIAVMLASDQPFDLEGYERTLRQLPELPEPPA